MDKAQALIEIVRDARKDRASASSYRRVVKALKVLGLSTPHIRHVLEHLEYVNSATGEPHPWTKGRPVDWLYR